jgi:hypothetical protein
MEMNTHTWNSNFIANRDSFTGLRYTHGRSMIDRVLHINARRGKD